MAGQHRVKFCDGACPGGRWRCNVGSSLVANASSTGPTSGAIQIGSGSDYGHLVISGSVVIALARESSWKMLEMAGRAITQPKFIRKSFIIKGMHGEGIEPDL